MIDDSKRINALISSSSGKKLILRSGIYNILSTLICTVDNVRIETDGRVVFNSPKDIKGMKIMANGFRMSGPIFNNVSSTKTQTGIDLGNVHGDPIYKDVEITNCEVNGWLYGMGVARIAGGIIEKNQLNNNIEAGISIGDFASDFSVERNRIYDTKIHQGIGVQGKQISNIELFKNWIKRSGDDGIKVNANLPGESLGTISNIRIIANILEENGDDAIEIYRFVEGAIVSQNQCVKNKVNGIYLRGCKKITANANQCIRCGSKGAGSGINLYGVSDSILSSNFLEGNYDGGISVGADSEFGNGSENNNICGNTCKNNDPQKAGGMRSGIAIFGCDGKFRTDNNLVNGNILFDDQVEHTQSYGLLVSGTGNPIVWLGKNPSWGNLVQDECINTTNVRRL